jgi:hypothetical protein
MICAHASDDSRQMIANKSWSARSTKNACETDALQLESCLISLSRTCKTITFCFLSSIKISETDAGETSTRCCFLHPVDTSIHMNNLLYCNPVTWIWYWNGMWPYQFRRSKQILKCPCQGWMVFQISSLKGLLTLEKKDCKFTFWQLVCCMKLETIRFLVHTLLHSTIPCNVIDSTAH